RVTDRNRLLNVQMIARGQFAQKVCCPAYIQIGAGPATARITQTAVLYIPRGDPRFSERSSDRAKQFEGSDGLRNISQLGGPTPAMDKNRDRKRPGSARQPQFAK